MNPKLHVRIISPKEVIFEADASSVSSVNSLGKFDILPLHANFISLIENKPIIIRTLDNKQSSFTFKIAIIYFLQDKVNIYTDIQLNIPQVN